MSSGVGMIEGLLRKAGTGPGRFTLPVVQAKMGNEEITMKKAQVPVIDTSDPAFYLRDDSDLYHKWNSSHKFC